MMTEVNVNAGKPYTVNIGCGLISKCGSIISKTLSPCKIAIISDSNVGPLYLSTVEKSLVTSGYKTVSYIFPAGETSKNVSTLSKIWEFLANNEFTRSDAILALGGGVVGDVAGFASATYMRGIPCIQMPTSLLAAVDSSVGGKTAIDLNSGKNLAGVFSQPVTVICDISTLKTLEPDFISDGAAECIKYAVLGNENILKFFKSESLADCIISGKSAKLTSLISESVKTKSSYVESDEFDRGQRMFLNLGHTLGHAIEKASDFEISHGHAVAIGMVLISSLGEHLSITESGTTAKLTNLITNCGLSVKCPYKYEELISALELDKKRNGNKITLVIPKIIGKCELKEFSIDELKEALKTLEALQ